MKSKSKSLSSKLIMPGIIIAAFMVTFASCKKTDLKSNTPLIESFAVNDNATVVVPDVSNISQRQTEASEKYNTFYGPQVQMGNGHARTWVNITKDGKPTAIGVELTDGALSNLPQDPNDLAAATWTLNLHQKAQAVTPFDHVSMDWNVNGHPPVGVYDLPHFDFHFYKISVAEQMAIPPYEVDPSGFDAPIAAGYLPLVYVRIPGGVPEMGAHWFDPTSPEWHGGGFTTTFIYGTYDSKVIFDEPMITLATLQSGATIQNNIPQPEKFDPEQTYYPTQYTIWKNAANGRHYVSLDNMVWR